MSPISRPNFDALRELHNSANKLIRSPTIQRSLIHHQQEVDKISEASMTMLDVCGTTKDILLLVKDHIKDLQSTFRRTFVSENKFDAHLLQRKKLKKEMSNRLRTLKRMKSKCVAYSDRSPPAEGNLVVVVNVLRALRETTAAILESLISLVSMPRRNQNMSRRIFGGKLMQGNSMSLMGKEKEDSMMMQIASEGLECVDVAIQDLEVEVECMFRRLIQTRVSLLNILTN